MSTLEDGLRARISELEAGIEALEEEIVGERAKAIEARKAAFELSDLLTEAKIANKDLADELKEAETELRKMEKEIEELQEAGTEEIEEARELLIDYLISIGEPVRTFMRASRELQALCDVLL